MNILLYDMGSYTQKDLIQYLMRAGHHCKNIPYLFRDPLHDDFFSYRFEKYIAEGNYDCVISTNFHPLVSEICYRKNIKYISWSYDSPISRDYKEYYQYPTNYIFLFDRMETEYFRSQGLEHVFHLPLAVNTERLNSLTVSPEERAAYQCDISFIGQFYKSPLKELMYLQDDYDKGYIQAIVDAQLKVYGYNFVDESVSQDMVDKLNQTFEKHNLTINGKDSRGLTRNGLIHSIDKEITRTERLVLLSLLNKFHDVNYYSTESPSLLKDVTYCGTAHYFTEMPKVFKVSKINLNITLKSIHSGIPLRALDIMGSGGFLLTNYQPEFMEYFVPEESIVMYESIADAVKKAEFYLTHEDSRQQIINHSMEILKQDFNYPSRILKMFKTAGL